MPLHKRTLAEKTSTSRFRFRTTSEDAYATEQVRGH